MVPVHTSIYCKQEYLAAIIFWRFFKKYMTIWQKINLAISRTAMFLFGDD